MPAPVLQHAVDLDFHLVADRTLAVVDHHHGAVRKIANAPGPLSLPSRTTRKEKISPGNNTVRMDLASSCMLTRLTA